MISKHWQLRDEIYRAFHNWPFLVGLFLAGATLGWLAGFVWPAYHRASREIYVALNPYRTYSDEKFLALAKPRYANIDNYHYWQMNELKAAITSDAVIAATLDALRAADPYWKDVDVVSLEAMLRSEWRTAGSWELTATHSDAQRARQAAQAWSDVAAESTRQALIASRDVLALDQQLAQVSAARLEANNRVQALQAAAVALPAWQARAAALPPAEPLPAGLRWEAYALTTAFATEDAAWKALLAEQPAPDAPASAFLEWTASAAGLLNGELALLPAQAASLDADYASLKEQFSAASKSSRGLSPNLEVESIGEVTVQAVRPAHLLALIGGFVGLLGWLVLQVWRAGRYSRKTGAEALAAEPGRG